MTEGTVATLFKKVGDTLKKEIFLQKLKPTKQLWNLNFNSGVYFI
jgi:hypothetical protein